MITQKANTFWGMYFEAEEAGAVVNMTKVGSPSTATIYLESSIDEGKTWQSFDAQNQTTPITLVNIGNRVYFRTPDGYANLRYGGTSTAAYRCFTLSKKCKAGGNIMSLCSPTPTRSMTTNSYTFYRLFYNCTNLTESPLLTNYRGAANMYRQMFYGCSSLRCIDVNAFYPNSTSRALNYQWTVGVPSTGTFRCLSMYGDNNTIERGESSCPVGWTVENKKHIFAVFSGTIYSDIASTMECSFDGGDTWTDLSATTTNTHNVCCIRSKTEKTSVNGSNYTSIFCNGSSKSTFMYAGGDLRYLLSPTANPVSVGTNTYNGVFYNCSSLKIQNCTGWLSALTSSCYKYMFSGCTKLSAAPELPVTTLADYCYSSMFNGCSSLSAAPALPATTLADYCYSNMFRGCTSLTAAPELPATTLATYCYSGMFNGCKSLTTAPALPVTTLATYCYQYMFSGCTSLSAAPALPATTLAADCYSGMFRECTSLTAAPSLPATTLATDCYYYMFNGCTSLASIDVSFSAWTGVTTNWVTNAGTQATGTKTFTCPTALGNDDTITRGNSYCPDGWTVVNI